MPVVIDGTNTSTFPGVDGTTMLQGSVAMPRMVLSTAQNTTSGTSIDFTSIPSWVKRITVMFNGVSLNGTASLLVQLGTSGGVVATGYTSTGGQTNNANATNAVSSTAGFAIYESLAAGAFSGQMTMTLLGSNVWISSHAGKYSTTQLSYGGGDISLGGQLDRVRVTSTGADTFDAGSVNLLLEG